MTDPTPLSPAARAVLNAAVDAYGINYSEFYCCADRVAAAALHAVADQVVPPALEEEFFDRNQALPLKKMVEIRLSLLAIATELEGQHD